jgi:hypothetical protein
LTLKDEKMNLCERSGKIKEKKIAKRILQKATE